jgi:hypothetical protein
MKIENELIQLTQALTRLRGDSSTDAEVERDAVREKIHIIGRTASFFGGFSGMTELHDACEAIEPGTGSVLNRAWDGIGGWWA